MNYSSYIDNVTSQKWGLNVQQAYLFDWLYKLPSWADKVVIEGKDYFFASKNKAVTELPLLTSKTDTMYRFYRQLEDLGLIEITKVGNKDYVRLTEKAKSWGKSDLSDKNPTSVGRLSEFDPEERPTNKNTILNHNISDNTPLPPASGGEEGTPALVSRDEEKIVADLERRKKEFRRHVFEVGGLRYTDEMLSNFCDYWTQPDHAVGKAKKLAFEKQKKWDPTYRLRTWAKNNLDGIVCYLTEDQKTIEMKKRDFIAQLKPFTSQYPREMLNDFYKHWAQAENADMPKRLRWELEEFWELSTRLSQWHDRDKNRNASP